MIYVYVHFASDEIVNKVQYKVNVAHTHLDTKLCDIFNQKWTKNIRFQQSLHSKFTMVIEVQMLYRYTYDHGD